MFANLSYLLSHRSRHAVPCGVVLRTPRRASGLGHLTTQLLALDEV